LPEAKDRTYSHSSSTDCDRVFAKTDLHLLEILKKRSLATKAFGDYWLFLREQLSKTKKATSRRKKD